MDNAMQTPQSPPIDRLIDLTTLTLPFSRISAADLPRVGGKGANLGELARAGFPVPPGFCVTTAAFVRFLATCPDLATWYRALEELPVDDLAAVRNVGERLRARLLELPMPGEVAEAVLSGWQEAGPDHAYAVRSSATAEDLPGASFAGQQDTYLNIRGREALLEAVRACWVSLFTDRAISYRAQNGFPHRDVLLSVVVQRMVDPEISGILFTADPVTGNRHMTSIDAGFGLGEALVSGLISADLYRIDRRSGKLLEVKLGEKSIAIRSRPEGGTWQETLSDERRTAQVLSEKQALELSDLGARIQTHFGSPQDIEWCIEAGQLYVVQARPITSLYPLPEPGPSDGTSHLYFSFSHAQMMTDAMSPMGISVWRYLLSFGRAADSIEPNPLLVTAGGRLFVDVTTILRLRPFDRIVPRLLTLADELVPGAIRQVIQSSRFQEERRTAKQRATFRGIGDWVGQIVPRLMAQVWWKRPEGCIQEVNQLIEERLEQGRRRLQAAPAGVERLKVARVEFSGMLRAVVIRIMPLIAGGNLALQALKRLARRYGNVADADALALGYPENAATQMDLEVERLADVARVHPALVAHLEAREGAALEDLERVEGGAAFRAALDGFLARFGMRGPSEIDVSRPRYRDAPGVLIQMVLGDLKSEGAGANRSEVERLAREAGAAGQRLVADLRKNGGFLVGMVAKRLVRVARGLLGIREHPKFFLVQYFEFFKEAVREAAAGLKAQGRIQEVTDIWFLRLEELIEALENPGQELRARIAGRQADLVRFQRLTPPRVMTSEGEIPVVKFDRADLPAGAIPGTAASAGVVEGVARVLFALHGGVLYKGEILVAPFTDPAWTPLFNNAAGVVTEVGGLMTHGAVVARERKIPAVVCAMGATTLIRTGQRVRVDGTRGFVEILPDVEAGDVGESVTPPAPADDRT